uniref:Cytochrome c oxidase subunit 2 n=1 Tax=Arcuatula senhousia TaxID=1954227 RepID=E2DHW4_ARCSE|nr:cytochrome c oxidase subunit II [Arcuatula senhousia]ACY00225.1 cytochrome c oxidase subunit II [Arcuatula senhousia]
MFSDVVSKVGMDIMKYHGLVMMIIVFILSLVTYMSVFLLCSSLSYRHHTQWEALEYGWTMLPILLLSVLWWPSMSNLYCMNDVKTPEWTFKAVGSQWYWSYEFHLINQEVFEFQSYMNIKSGTSLYEGGYRLLDVDWRMVVPAKIQTTIYVTSTDVLHSFSIPSSSIKVDAIPGRINQIPYVMLKTGVYYGQCSELWGVNHSFMPIVVEVLPSKVFFSWLEELTNFVSEKGNVSGSIVSWKMRYFGYYCWFQVTSSLLVMLIDFLRGRGG